MKKKHRRKILKQPDLADPTVFPNAEWPDEKQVVVFVSKPARPDSIAATDASEAYAKAFASIATNAWKARTRINSAPSAAEDGLLKRIGNDVERIWNVLLEELGLEIKDHTGTDFDYGMALKVVTTQPTPSIKKERVIETIKPTIFWRNRIIQMGEVVIATPA